VSDMVARRSLCRLPLLGLGLVLGACSLVSKEPVAVERPRPVVTEPPPPVAIERQADAARGHRVVAIARKHVGAPYRWGGSSPAGFDCSGFVRYVYAQVGVSLPHNAAKQYRLGTPVSRDNLEPGDLVFFDRLRHNGIYVGNGRFIHSRQTGKRVAIAGLGDEWYAEHFAGARRLPARVETDR
jgi:cell wall-associated NlpC family hydrolase